MSKKPARPAPKPRRRKPAPKVDHVAQITTIVQNALEDGIIKLHPDMMARLGYVPAPRPVDEPQMTLSSISHAKDGAGAETRGANALRLMDANLTNLGTTVTALENLLVEMGGPWMENKVGDPASQAVDPSYVGRAQQLANQAGNLEARLYAVEKRWRELI